MKHHYYHSTVSHPADQSFSQPVNMGAAGAYCGAIVLGGGLGGAIFGLATNNNGKNGNGKGGDGKNDSKESLGKLSDTQAEVTQKKEETDMQNIKTSEK